MSRRKPLKLLRVAVMMDKALVPPDELEGLSEEKLASMRTEVDVCTTLRAIGHEIRKLGVHDDLSSLREAISEFKPHVAFNLLEGFRDWHVFDQHVVSFLELMQQPYTGCNPRGLTIARDKALTKKIMAYHRIRAPAFAVFPRRKTIARPKKLAFPLLVKSVNVEGSVGIAQASIVNDEEKLKERVRYIHEALGTYAIAEQYIDGREFYVGVIGNQRLKTFPVWELVFEHAREGMAIMATEQAKWNRNYQKRWGITTRAAADVPEGFHENISSLCKRIYRILGLTGYARLDFRMTAAGELYLLEANPNPQLAAEEDFAESAKAAAVSYDQLIQQILALGMSYRPEHLS